MQSCELTHYQNQGGVVDIGLLEADAITFSVLISILGNPCTDIYTNHKSVIICYSFPPFPVWVWVKDPGCDGDVESIGKCLKEAFPVEKGHAYNLSQGLLERLQEKDPYFRQVGIKMGLLSHRLDRIQPITHPCDGRMAPAEDQDIGYLTRLWHNMCYEMEGFRLDEAHCRNRVLKHMENGGMFTWRNAAGEIVALTVRADAGKYSKISGVYTLPEHRRKGYAINLVHKVSESILADGLIPILYTNAGYVASNACYRKIGFTQVGNLVTVIKG